MASASGVNIREMFQGALTEDDIVRAEEEIAAGRAVIERSPSGKSAMLLQSIHSLHCWAAAGEMSEIVALEADIARRASEVGYDRLTVLPSRNGWDRVLERFGWKLEPVRALVKEL